MPFQVKDIQEQSLQGLRESGLPLAERRERVGEKDAWRDCERRERETRRFLKEIN